MEDLKQSLANGDISAESLVDRIEEQAREIEDWKLVAMAEGDARDAAQAELAALKARPSGVVLPEKYDDDTTYGQGRDDAIDEVARLNQPASAGDERSAFIRDFKLDGKIYYDENTRQWLPTLDSVEGFNLAQRVTACWVGWQARAALSANHSEQVRGMVGGWIKCSERMPECGTPVQAYYLNSHGKGRTIRAHHIKAWTVEVEPDDPDVECVEYSEQQEAYYLLEGWYELMDNWEQYSSIAVTEGVITQWAPLLPAPKELFE